MLGQHSFNGVDGKQSYFNLKVTCDLLLVCVLAVLYCAVQCSVVQCSVVQCSAMQCSVAQ